jgi:TPR repeat protein
MGTPADKPANPGDPSSSASRAPDQAGRPEQASGENEHDPLRSPYAPKSASRRAAGDPAPDARPPEPDGMREVPWRSAAAVAAADESRLAHREPLTAEGPPLDPAADDDLARLEASLRWLQRQQPASRLPPAPRLHASPGLAPPDPQARPYGTYRPAGEYYAPRSLEPQRLVPPPEIMAGRSHLIWLLLIFLSGAVVAAPVYYYFAAGAGGQSAEPAARQQALPEFVAAVAPPPVIPQAAPPVVRQTPQSIARPSAEPAARETAESIAPPRAEPVAPPPEPAPVVARDDEPEVSTGIDTARQAPTASNRAKGPARASTELANAGTIAMLRSDPGETPSRAAAPPIRTLDEAEIALLRKQGDQFMAAGDLVTARTVFRRAAEAGDAYAALALGATYDPNVLARIGALGVDADVDQARSWYQRAESLGSREAAQRLSALARP